jgi:hypothetical protein
MSPHEHAYASAAAAASFKVGKAPLIGLREVLDLRQQPNARFQLRLARSCGFR